jgi:competence protein ComEC
MGYRNRYRHPNPAVVERYQTMHAKAYRSDESGALIMDFSTPAGIKITPWRQYAKRYWQES